ncbi:MAG: GDP-mannose 4,6-dehydratase [Candidatus Anstonellales archaeon]
MKKAFITGITGQDGRYLAELLISKGYEVHGLVRKVSGRDEIGLSDAHIHYGDITDSSFKDVLFEIRPDEIYNLAGQSDVYLSFKLPIYTFNVNTVGLYNILEYMRVTRYGKLYQASTSEMFGGLSEYPIQNENTPFNPKSPYGISKLASHLAIKNYRESYGLWCCSGILFNHESPRRGLNFVSKKIAKGVVDIVRGRIDRLEVGNLNAIRDWGYAKDYVEAMWLMLQRDEPKDYVIATGECHTVREFIEEAFKLVGYNIEWYGEGLNEVGVIGGKVVVSVNDKYYRPNEVNYLCGDSTLAREELGWRPRVTFKDLVKLMVDYEIGRGR